MKFECGSTRYVLCVGGIVIKIARIKVLYWTLRFLHWQERGGVLQKAAVTTAEQKFSALKHLFAGVTANLEEFGMYRRYSHLPIAPTFFSFFGLFNIQARGVPIDADELVLCPFRKFAPGMVDLKKPENFGRIDGKIYLLDYGFEELNVLLAEYAASLQVVYN